MLLDQSNYHIIITATTRLDKGAFLLKAPSFLLDEDQSFRRSGGISFYRRRGEWRRQVERCRDYSPPFSLKIG